ncbi:MAG: DNA phosphorothioation-associated putative methyltransferase [Myxococcales bacterium]|nr:DNA phosphorothioation-associated putative methyltransferase [Myxococcales bacterium]
MASDPMTAIARHKTAIGRARLSRPLRLAWEAGLVDESASVTDYGCGRGDDIRHLRALGVDAVGWDPEWRPAGARRRSQVVNLGYVLNVIERPDERVEVLRAAFALAEQVLVVAALVAVETARQVVPFGDGVLTSRGTFQKYFDQGELERLIRSSLDVEPVALGVGVFAVVRDAGRRATCAAGLFRRRVTVSAVPQVTAEALFEAHRAQFAPLLDFVEARGRLPRVEDGVPVAPLEAAFGDLRRALAVARKALPEAFWAQAAQRATEDLLVYLALSRFGGRPKFNELDSAMQGDVLVFCGRYAEALRQADALLMSVGDASIRRAAAAASPVGKRLPDALYVHTSALGALPGPLRVFFGCAQRYLGAVEGANVVKLGLDGAKVSFLAYPGFEAEPHPALAWSLKLDLQSFRVRLSDFAERENPPVLHRKETLVELSHPDHEKFARLTAQEERFGLLDEPQSIGTRAGWEAALARAGVSLRGHRVVRSRGGV